MEWKFKKYPPDDIKDNPQHLEFFRSEALEQSHDALIREDIQNRLDAKSADKGWPVRVRYHLSSSESHLTGGKTRKWLEGLQKHVNSPMVQSEIGGDKIDFSQPIRFLTIEDFNTKGLKGDVSQTMDPTDEEEEKHGRNDFFWLIRNVGRSGKKKGDRGRWGLGKIVYSASSKCRSYFVYSIREDDLSQIIIGRSVLAIHRIGDSEYKSEGFFGEFPDADYPYKAMPGNDGDEISEFCNDFGIKRTVEQPGTSTVIPNIHDDINLSNIITSLIDHYYWEILMGRLEVEVSEGDVTYTLAEQTIKDFVDSWGGFKDEDKIDLRNKLDFCKAAEQKSLKQGGYYELKVPRSYNSPIIKKLFQSEELFEDCKRRFLDNEIIACEHVVEVSSKSRPSKEKYEFMVYLQKDDDLDQCDEYFIRDGLTIIGEKHLKERGVRALIVAESEEEESLSELLGDAENPAHTKWLHNSKNFLAKEYDKGKAILNYVQKSAAKMVQELTRFDGEESVEILKEYFNVPFEDPGEGKGKKKRKRKRRIKKPVVVVKSTPKTYELSKIKSGTGFRLRHLDEGKGIIESINLKVIYPVASGKQPKHRIHDFDFTSNVMWQAQGCKVVPQQPNVLRVDITEDEFILDVTGFDENRDLDVRARAKMISTGVDDNSDVHELSD